ncbi:MAG: TIGR00730 family Rossman fold protein [Ilumatobacteraceae bacterium]
MSNDELAALADTALEGLDLSDTITDRRVARSLLREALGLLADGPHALDLKIATNALAEMRDAYEMFAPFRDRRKVTIFGSARTGPDDPVYRQTVRVAAELAARGWMVVTGAGPGIMQAGMEGAGREASIGVSIRLPFETGANPVIAGDAKYVSMKYFFTRKLMLIKESAAFVCLPGGFGTLDETFELLTLTQTGKGVPVPIVLLDTPDDPYWEAVDTFVREHLVARGMVSADDVDLYRIRHGADGVAEEIEGFYRNYDSIRFVGDRLIIRLREIPVPSELEALRSEFADLSRGGSISETPPTAAEVADDDRLDLPRLAVDYDPRHAAGLRRLIDRLNDR